MELEEFNFNFEEENNTTNAQEYSQPTTSSQQHAYSNRRVVLSVENLTKTYGDRYAVDDISFSIYEGQIFGFLGANGAGKSTTIKMLTGLTNITSGNAYINGYSVKTNFEKAIKNVGAIIEIPQFYPYLSGYNNLKFFAKLSEIKVTDSRIQEVADLVGLGQRIKDRVSNYSLGMKQRLGVAQALLHHPKILILDEPTNGLDANGIREFRLLLKTLAVKENICILISSHILAEMENMCDIIAIIDKGKIIEFKTLEEIKQQCTSGASQYIKCNAPNYAGKLLIEKHNLQVKIQGDKVFLASTNKTDLSKAIVTLTQNNILVFGAGDVDYSLEEVFLNIINRNNQTTSIS
ncbi:MAG: ABC transporter ATP-binding protein [Clostridia bacterium]|nr:ABC transporter ATP-binding protein [Clostridia bacterium]